MLKHIGCIGVSNPPQKHPLLFFARRPQLNLQIVQAPLFGEFLIAQQTPLNTEVFSSFIFLKIWP